MSEIAIKVEHLSKKYRLGAVGTKTLYGDLNRWWYKVREAGKILFSRSRMSRIEKYIKSVKISGP